MPDPSIHVILRAIQDDIAELKGDMKGVKTEQQKTRDLFNRGRGALYIITALGAFVVWAMGYWHDLFRALFHLPGP